MDGVLVIDKPAGVTSHDVVDEVRRRLRTKKVGHGGTLDPDATGVLFIGVGRATRFLSYAQSSAKTYRAEVVFGITTSTQDASGEIIDTRPVTFDRTQIESTLEMFKGQIEQIPPMVSAVRVGGERLYEKARRGEVVERAARIVTIHRLALVDFREEEGTTIAILDITCSGGTYIRTLSHDLGESLGCGAHMRSLRRTVAGGFSLDEAVALEDISAEHLLPLTDVVRELPVTEVSDEEAASVANGRPLFHEDAMEEGAVTAVLNRGRLLGVYRKVGRRLMPERVVSQ